MGDIFSHQFSHSDLHEAFKNTSSANSSANSIPKGCVITEGLDYIPWDNEDNIVSKEVDDTIKLLFMGICMPLLFIVALCTNIISMVVFYKLGLQERINTCLFTLSLVDLLSLSPTFGYNSDVLYMFIIGKGRELGPSAQFFIRYYMLGLNGLVTSSQMVYAVIALERCLCVMVPFLAKTLMPTKVTVIALWTMTLVITGCCVPIVGARYSLVCVFDRKDGSMSYVNGPTDFYYRHKFIMDVLYAYVYGLLFPGLSFACVTISTAVTVIKLKKIILWRQTTSSTPDFVSSRDLATTRVIVATSVLFIVCIVPGVVMRAFIVLVPNFRAGGRYSNLAWVCIRVYMLASAINSTFNFFVYYVYGSKFRETTGDLFSFCRTVSKPSNTNRTTTIALQSV